MDRLESADVSLGFDEKDWVMFPTEPLSLDVEMTGGEMSVALIIRLVEGEGDKLRAENVALPEPVSALTDLAPVAEEVDVRAFLVEGFSDGSELGDIDELSGSFDLLLCMADTEILFTVTAASRCDVV